MIRDRNSIEVPIFSAIVNLYQRYIQGAIFMNIPLTSVPATPYTNCRKFIASVGVINVWLYVKKLKCYLTYPSTIFVRIRGRPSLTSTFTFTKPSFTSESEHFTFHSAYKYITHLFGTKFCYVHSQINHKALSTIYPTCPRSVKNSTYWVIQHIQLRQPSEYLY
jgi:hypothetical protein